MATSYDEVLLKPLEEAKTILQQANYRELQGFLQHVGVSAGGKQPELLQRALEHVEQHQAEQTHGSKVSKATAGFTAKGSAGASSSSTGILAQKFRKAKSATTGVSRTKVLLEKALATKDVEKTQDFGAQDEPGKWTPELEQKRLEMQSLLAQTREVPAALPGVPPLPGGTGADDKEIPGLKAVLDTLGVVVTGINELREGMAATVKYGDLKQFHEMHSKEIQTYVCSRVDPIVEDQVEIKSNVVDLMKDAVYQDERIGKLENRVEELLSSKGKGPDLSFKRIVFKGFPEKIALDDRLECMKRWMEKHFPKLDFTYGVFYNGSFKEKSRKITRVGYAECTSSDIRNAVFDRIEGKITGPSIGGKTLKVEKARSQSATDRNNALTEAADLLKRQPGLQKEDVQIVWKDKRGVKVKDEVAFEQPPGKELGSFKGDFAYLEADS